MTPRSISPASTADQNAEHQRKEPDHAATPQPSPPQKGHLRHTGRHPSPHGRRAVLPVHPPRPPGGPRVPPGVEAGEKERQRVGHGGRPSLGRQLERHHGRLPGSGSRNLLPPARNTRHGLHALPAFHSWKNRHTITLHPLDHNPHRWTPEADATATITIQQNPENPEEYHITRNDPAPIPPPPQPSQTSSPPSAQNCRKRKPNNKWMKRCPRHHRHQPHRKTPAQSPSPTPSPQWSSPHSTAPPQTATGFATCHGNGRSTTAHSDGTKSHQGSHHRLPLDHRTHHHLDTTNRPQPPPPHCPRGCHHHTNVGRPYESSPHPRRSHTPATIVGTYDGTSGPQPMATIVITYPDHNAHTDTWQQRWEDIRRDLLQEHLGLTRTHHNLHPVPGVDQAPHGIHTPGLCAYATPINPQAAEDITTALSIQQAQT